MKRGESGLSFVIGIDKQTGMSSHDVVSRCRRILGEKRIGHAGTLDPAASGVLVVCVGSAARLDKYLTGHDKSYVVDVAFGAATDTDDAEGSIIEEAPAPDALLDESLAAIYLNTFTGKMTQIPPAYSAIKVGGKKACDQARSGAPIELSGREVEIYSAQLLSITDCRQTSTPYIVWTIHLEVSKGTYVRSFARDLGQAVACPAHVLHLDRRTSGSLKLKDCVSLESLSSQTELAKTHSATEGMSLCVDDIAALDPVKLLGFRFAFLNNTQMRRVDNGNSLTDELNLHYACDMPEVGGCGCCNGLAAQSTEAPSDGELVSLVYENRLVAIYAYNAKHECYKADCILKPAVYRPR